MWLRVERRATRAHRCAGSDRRVRRRRRDADRGVLQVPAGRRAPPNWPAPGCVGPSGGPTTPAISGCRWPSSERRRWQTAGGRPARPSPGCTWTARRARARVSPRIDAAAAHARHEAEVGGYVAAEAAAPVLDAGRAAVAALTACPPVRWCSPPARSTRWICCSAAGRRAAARWPACPANTAPTWRVMAAHGFTVRTLPIRDDGRLALDDAAYELDDDPPDLVHLTPVASHSGVVQPLAMMARLCRELGLPLIVDAAQALGQVDCAVGADVDVLVVAQVDRGAARCGRAGGAARPVGAADSAAAGAGVGAVADGRPSSSDSARPISLRGLDFRWHWASTWRTGRSCTGPAGRAGRPQPDRAGRCAGVAGGRRGRGAQRNHHAGPGRRCRPAAVRAWLLAERRIVTTYAGVQRAPHGDDGAGAADLAASGHHGTGSRDLRRSPDRRDRGGRFVSSTVTSVSGQGESQ